MTASNPLSHQHLRQTPTGVSPRQPSQSHSVTTSDLSPAGGQGNGVHMNMNTNMNMNNMNMSRNINGNMNGNMEVVMLLRINQMMLLQ